jgi:hypothetical protein
MEETYLKDSVFFLTHVCVLDGLTFRGVKMSACEAGTTEVRCMSAKFMAQITTICKNDRVARSAMITEEHEDTRIKIIEQQTTIREDPQLILLKQRLPVKSQHLPTLKSLTISSRPALRGVQTEDYFS